MYPAAEEQSRVLTLIRGRETKFNARHTVDEWCAVIIACITDEAKIALGNARGFAQRNDYSGIRDHGWDEAAKRFGSNSNASKQPSVEPGPLGWHAILTDECPSNAYTTPDGHNYIKPDDPTGWQRLPDHARKIVRDRIERDAKGAAA